MAWGEMCRDDTAAIDWLERTGALRMHDLVPERNAAVNPHGEAQEWMGKFTRAVRKGSRDESELCGGAGGVARREQLRRGDSGKRLPTEMSREHRAELSSQAGSCAAAALLLLLLRMLLRRPDKGRRRQSGKARNSPRSHSTLPGLKARFN